MKTVAALIYAVALLGLALVCLLRPGAIQDWAVKHDERHPVLQRMNLFVSFIRKPAMLTYLRAMGLLPLVMAALIVFVVVYGDPPMR